MEPPGTDSADSHVQPLDAGEARGGTCAASAQASRSEARPLGSSGNSGRQALVNAASASIPATSSIDGDQTDAFAGINANGWQHTLRVRYGNLHGKTVLLCSRKSLGKRAIEHRSNGISHRSEEEWRAKALQGAHTDGVFESKEEAAKFALVCVEADLAVPGVLCGSLSCAALVIY